MLFIDRQSNANWAMSDALAGVDYISRLEARLEYSMRKRAVALCSVDAALHTALHLCGVGEGDRVFVPSFTFYSNVASVTNMGAQPVFLDCAPDTRCVSPLALDRALAASKAKDAFPKAVIVDDAFGSVADYDRLLPMCKANGVPLIELACDAYGGTYKGAPCGACGDYGVMGFNKRVGGGGGAILVDREEYPAAAEFVRAGYAVGENHDYRMHNVIAALDFAMQPAADKIAARAKANLAALCADTDVVVEPVPGDAASFALCRAGRYAGALRSAGFNVKRVPPVHTLAQYVTMPFFEHERGFCVCKSFSDCCLVDMDMSAFKRRRLAGLLNALVDK